MAAQKRTRDAPKEQGPERAGGGRGRPRKFAEPSQLVAVTLPVSALNALRSLHADLAWAIVQLVEQTLGDREGSRALERQVAPLAELVHLPGGRSLIVVQPKAFASLVGVSTIPLADGRAFLAFDHAAGLSDLEVAVIDRLEQLPPGNEERVQLDVLRKLLRSWRHDPRLSFRAKQILVVQVRAGSERAAVAPLQTRRPKRPSTD